MIPQAPMPHPSYAYTVYTPPKKEAPMPRHYRYNDRDGDRLVIQPRAEGSGEVHVAAPEGVFLPKDEAPAAALAILEAAGWPPGPHGYAQAVSILKDGIDARKARDKARDRLDADALQMLNAAFRSAGMCPVPALPEQIADFWRAAATAARTLYNRR